jgi:pimeloyl-ACP methyl ester carboxylesterase
MGGVVAQQFVHDFPHLTRKLVLVSTFSALRPDDLSGWIYFLRRILTVTMFGLHAQARVVAGRIFPGADQAALREMLIETISRADPRAYRGAMRALGSFDSRKWLAQINRPTLIVSGSADSTVSPVRQKLLVEGIPGARQVVIQDAGHALPVDHAETFNHILLEFLCAP